MVVALFSLFLLVILVFSLSPMVTGVAITGINEDSSLYISGVRAKDVIYAINAYPINSINDITNSYNPASIHTNKKNINIHSHLYPADIMYVKTEIILPINNKIYSFEYSNLNYGEFKDANTNYSFNSSEFLFKGSIKTQLFNRFSIGGSLGYGINKISNEFAVQLINTQPP